MKQYVKPMLIMEEDIRFETCCSCPLWDHDGSIGGGGGFHGGR